ncbi:ATP-binding cassette domain-containing protein [Plantibacter sp. YIM 135249]|uniref:ATP-binding cassette domain-containing protein n=1 Tax=Plantibacter sp. YIM 135249 TaxID=3423918 RepID=UPI003D358D9A
MPVNLENVGHRFDHGPWLFRNLSFRFNPGEVYALIGPSGSGKSTLLSLLARLEQPKEGIIHFDGVGRISWVFQNPFGSPRRTTLDHVTLPLLASGISVPEAERQGRELLSRFRLDAVADQTFRALSGGEAQRLMLARGLAAKPGLLLVDEPTAQLDRHTAAVVDEVIGSTSDPNTIVVVATHDPHTRDACTAHLDLSEAFGR